MVTYALQGPAHAGASVSLVTPAGTAGDLAPTGQGVGLLVVNNGGTAVNVVLPITPTYDGQAVANRVVSVPASTGAVAGFTLPGVGLIPLPDNVYGVGTTAITFGTVVNQILVAAIRIP